MLIANEFFAANKIGGIEGGNKLIEKFVELKCKKLLNSRKTLKFQKLFKF